VPISEAVLTAVTLIVIVFLVLGVLYLCILLFSFIIGRLERAMDRGEEASS
jgi:hypothetical protein